VWDLLWATEGAEIQVETIQSELFSNFRGINIDDLTDPYLKKVCGAYATARISINYIIYYLSINNSVSLPDFNDFGKFAKWINDVRRELKDTWTREKVASEILQLQQKNPRIQFGEAGFSKNIFEFLRHSLGQKTTLDVKERSFDQGYWCIKSGDNRSSRWVTRFGPVSVIMLVSLAIRDRIGTAAELTAFLANFGIYINPDRLLESSIGQSLMDLGLTNDSPDGERGVIILNHFYISKITNLL
jgi:hypothetical protein